MCAAIPTLRDCKWAVPSTLARYPLVNLLYIGYLNVGATGIRPPRAHLQQSAAIRK